MQDIDPYGLDIGAPGKVRVGLGYTDTTSGKASSVEDIAKAADGLRFVFVGESHNSPDHHKAQADIIRALVKRGRDVTVGFEMFTRDNQPNINGWTLGWWSDEEFQIRSDWKKQWGYPYPLYKPIFDAVKEHGLPMVALNVPRDWVRQVGRTGPSAITPERQPWVPKLDLTNTQHRAVFNSLMGGHPMPGIDNIYAAQVTWDTGMAQSALDSMAGSRNKRRVMVVCAGSGHVMYGQGINWRVTQQTRERVLNVVGIDGDKPREVSRGLGDYVLLSPPGKE